MEKKFTSDSLPLSQLLEQAGSGALQLPDFQRGWVWDDHHIRSLLASISLSYPIGAVMTLQTGNRDVRFRPRLLEGVECRQTDPDLLLLDGQQRITSLFLALKSRQPVPTRDHRAARIDRHYYADIRASIAPTADREEDVITSVPGDRVIRSDFGRKKEKDLSTREKEIAEEMFPLDIVLDPGMTMDWQMAYMSDPETLSERIEVWKRFYEEIVSPFLQYQVPTIQLAKSTPKEAVCQVFEKVNTGGVTLTVFELLTATYAADDFNLRDDWAERVQNFEKHRLLHGLQATDFLQIVTLLSTFARRRSHLLANAMDENAPAVSCKRRDVLRLALTDYRRWADKAMEGLERTVQFMHGEHIFQRRDLPYTTQLVPLGAIFGVLGAKADSYPHQQRLRSWLWCGVFGEMYGGSTETRFANDLQDCVSWIVDDGPAPRTVRDAQFQADRLFTLRTRNSAAYKGLHALQLKRGCRDFQTGIPVDVNAYFDLGIDIHHVFPRHWCNRSEIDSKYADCVVNKTAIGSSTHRTIGGNAPSVYLRRIENGKNIKSQDLDGFLRSHDIDPVTLRKDDFASFFNLRFERMLGLIEHAMRKQVNRTAEGNESPFLSDDGVHELERDTRTLLDTGESRTVEFKSTGRKNLYTGDKDPKIEWSMVKSICGFMNRNGGTLLVGVDDGGKPVGIDLDYPFVKSGNRDGWELWLTDLVANTLGQVAVTDMSVSYCDVDGKTVARIDVVPGAKPVFAKTTKGDRHDTFMVRLNNSTEELAGQDLLDYLQKQWPTWS